MKKNCYYIPQQQQKTDDLNWDWVHYLHDAEIVSAGEESGSFSIYFNPVFANIKKITFYNYRILEIPVGIERTCWLSGKIEPIRNHHCLRARLERIDGSRPVHCSFAIRFQSISIEYADQ